MSFDREALRTHWIMSVGNTFLVVDAKASEGPPIPELEGDLIVADFAAGGGASSVANRNRNRNRNRTSVAPGAPQPGADILTPWREISLLHDLRPAWIDLPLDLPPKPSDLRRECIQLKDKLRKLEDPAQIGRKAEILRQRDLDLSDYFKPLGFAEATGFDQTARLFLIIARICEEVGLRYKARYDVPRPSVVSPQLRPFLENPAHASYPSNHSFQSFSMAYVFSRVAPEHPGVPELFRSAQRVAENREWAGIHYPSDTKAGKSLARMFTPILEVVLQEQMLLARAEWI